MGNVGSGRSVRILVTVTLAGVLIETACLILSAPPDQNQFLPLESLRDNGLAVARIYAAPIPAMPGIAVHTWLVVKEANAPSFDRWEVWQTARGPYQHVRHNLMSPTRDVGAEGTYLVAEVIGPEAEPIVEFVVSQSPSYACRGTYTYFPGPNSNTYTQWVLDNTAWNATLPPSAIGKDASPVCP